MMIADLVFKLVEGAIKIGFDAAAASKEEAERLAQRLTDAGAALAGERTKAHTEMDARHAALQAEFDALKAKA